MLNCRRVAVGLVVGTLFFAGAAEAHIKITSPKQRHAQDVSGNPQKTGPCGVGGAADVRANVNVFKPGQTIKVEWTETITHPGHFRILFDKDGQNFPNPASYTDYDAGGSEKTILDNIPHAGPKYSQSVTLPNIECANCTMQIVQVMTDKPPYTVGGDDLYYHCVDMILSNDPDAGVPPVADSGIPVVVDDAGNPVDPIDPDPASPTGGSDSGSAGASADAGKKPKSAAAPADDGGCSMTATGMTTAGGSAIGAAALFGLALATMVARRKR